jgi:hypothetical protein
VQPYQHLARVWRAEGKYSEADAVTFRRLQIERERSKHAILAWGKYVLLEVPFKYGLSVPRATLTVTLLVLAGWMATEVANYGHIRIVPWGTNPDGVIGHVPVLGGEGVLMTQLTTVSGRADEPGITPFPIDAPEGEIPCDDQIETLIYAFDVFVPLLDLQQESQCAVTGDQGAWAWRFAKGLYAVIGWYAISAFILTVSGLLRRQVEPA